MNNVFDVFIDESGDLKADNDDEPYGCGWFVAQRGEVADRLRNAIRSEFPSGFHFKDFRKVEGKLRGATRLLTLLPRDGFFFPGAHVIADPAYARKHHAAVLIEDLPSSALQYVVDSAPIGAQGLVQPADVLHEMHDAGRLCAAYGFAARIPVIALLNAPGCPDPSEVQLHIGIVGHAPRYHYLLRLLRGHLEEGSARYFQRLRELGDVPPLRSEVEIRTVSASCDALFAVADLFAAVGRHHVLRTPGLAEPLLELAKPHLGRAPWTPAKCAVVTGLSVWPNPPNG